MKWSVIALVVLGCVAALAAMMLVNALRNSSQRAVAQEAAVIEETTIVVASRHLPKGTILDRNMVETRQVLLKDVPQGSVGDSEQAVWKVLAKPIRKGEAFLKTMFAQKLGEALPNGKMLLNVSVHGSSASLDLGCTVNVIWTSDPRKGEEAESAMLMSGISVWGIGDRTIVSPEGETGRSSSRDKTVMLLLDMDQTQRITVATQSGFISLPLCNPEDTWAAADVSEPEPAPEGPQTDSEPSEEWEVWTINGEESERSTFVKEGEVWRPRENPE